MRLNMVWLISILWIWSGCNLQEPDTPDAQGPVISSIAPLSGPAGTLITVSGGNFSTTPELNMVSMGNKETIPVSASSSQIVIKVPDELTPGQYRVIVRVGKASSASAQFFNLVDKAEITDPEVLSFNYTIGTQTIGPSYGHTNDDRLIETSKATLELGSNILKISLSTGSYNITGRNYSSLTALVRDDPSFRHVFDMPFSYYFLWARSHSNWKDGYSAQERAEDSIQIADLTKYLLTKYNQSGKKFYLGHWEGDWYLLDNYNPDFIPSDTRINGMIQWYSARQNAVDAAKNQTAHQNVEVYTYAEVNRVVDAMNGRKRVVNEVLPHTKVDYVSYSSYDSQMLSQTEYNRVLDYIEGNLPQKPGIQGKRVFIGEMGRNAQDYGFNKQQHEQVNRELIRKSLIWGAPFVLYWEMYNNEIRDGVQRGFWLIDDKNEKWPLYQTYNNFYKKAKIWVSEFKATNKRLPSGQEYLSWAQNELMTK